MPDSTPRRTLKELLTAQEPQWLVKRPDSSVLGPVPEVMLLKAVLRGGLDESTMVHPVGQPQWRPIQAYPRLTKLIARLRSKISNAHAVRSRAATPAAEADEPSHSTLAPRSEVREKRLSPPPRPSARASGE